MKRFSKNDQYVIAMIALDAEKNGMSPQDALAYAVNHVVTVTKATKKTREKGNPIGF
jgi:uncharacterized OB-fold protein